jgi:hypothetical protein
MVGAVRCIDGDLDLTSEKLPGTVNTAPFGPGGAMLSYGSDKSQGSDQDFFKRSCVSTGRSNRSGARDQDRRPM